MATANVEEAIDEIEDAIVTQQTPVSPVHARDFEDSPSDNPEKRPWYRRPSPFFILPGMFLLALAVGSTMPSKLELLNLMACRSYSPHYSPETNGLAAAEKWLPHWLAEGRPLDSAACRHDSDVQQIVANLILGLTLTTGILSAILTTYWMDVSNRYGRTPIIAFILFAFLVGDSIFLFTVYYVDKVSIYMILVSGVVEGFGGGLMTMMALTNAYIADATPTGSRSGTFSLVGGCLFGGIGLGPSWGAILIRIFGHNPLAPYVLALACYSFCVMSLLTFVPESLSWSRRLSYREEKAQRLTATAKSFWRNTFGFLRPLRLLLPHRTYEATLVSHQNPPQSHLDWTLTKIAMAYAMQSAIYACLTYKVLYAQYTFGWGPREVGFLMTAAGCSRVLYLVAVLPLLTKLLRKKPKQSIILEGEEDPLLVLDQEVEDTESSQFSNPDQLRKSNEEAQRMRQMHDSNFDLSLSRFSLLIEFAVFIGFAFNTSQTQFIICSFCQALGAGAQPALQSLSLSKVSAQDSGRVLAAMTVCQTLSAQVLGPLAFGGLYAATIKTLPTSIFIAASILLALAMTCMFTVRTDKRSSIVSLD